MRMSSVFNNKLIDILPPNMQDSYTEAMGYAIDREYVKLAKYIKTVLILGDIGNATEHTLDAMALDIMPLDYDVTLPYSTKLNLFKENVYRNKFTKGTATTVERGVSILYGSSSVTEWFEATPPLEPYTFKVRALANQNGDSLLEYYQKITDVVAKTKNVRSHLAGIEFVIKTPKPTAYVGTHTTVAQRITIGPYIPPPVKIKGNVHPYLFMKTGQKITIGGEAPTGNSASLTLDIK